MKQFKKLIACVLAATLVLGSTTVFFGAEKTTSTEVNLGGGGNFEGTVDTEIFNVKVPTVNVATNTAFDFILDPEGLIETTSGAAHKTSDSSVTFVTYGSMYFEVTDGKYDVKSQVLTAENKSSVDVNITLQASVTVPPSNSAVTFVTDKAWTASDEGLEIYLAVAEVTEVSGDAVTLGTETAIANTATVTSSLVKFDAYKTIYDTSTGKYQYVIDDTLNVTADTYSFCLTGACNTEADWSGYDETANPTISIVWKVEMVGAEVEDIVSPTPTIVKREYTVPKADLTVALQLGTDDTAATGISTVKLGAAADSFATTNNLTKCTLSSDKTSLTLPLATLFSGATSGDVRYVQITFNDTAKTSVVLKITFQ